MSGLVSLIAMGILSRRPTPQQSAGVVYVYDRRSDLPPYYSVVCDCGWSAEPVDSAYPNPEVAQAMAAAALAHDPGADTATAFPLDEPQGA